MGLVSTANRASTAVVNGRAKDRSGVTDTTMATDNLLDKFPIALRHKVLNKAVRAAGNVVKNSARVQVKPYRSRVTGSRKHWSKKIRNRREGGEDLYQSIKTVVRQYDRSGKVVAVSGPTWRWGRHGLLVERGGVRKLWGTDRTAYVPPRPFMRRAGDGTVSEQRKAMVKVTTAEWVKV